MRHRKLCIITLMLLGITACRTSTSAPDPPPRPQGYISYTGHRHYYCVSLSSHDEEVWYAYWNESHDSLNATLLVGISSGDTDHIYLRHDISGWRFASNDSRSNYPVAFVYSTTDSVIVGWHGIDCGTYYYLKKM